MRLSVPLLAGAIALAPFPTRAVGQETSSCLTHPSPAIGYVEKVRGLIGGQDSTLLASVGLPYAQASDIVLETNKHKCNLAVSAYNSLFPAGKDSGDLAAALFVIKIGTNGYATVRPGAGIGEWEMLLFFDPQWNPLPLQIGI